MSVERLHTRGLKLMNVVAYFCAMCRSAVCRTLIALAADDTCANVSGSPIATFCVDIGRVSTP